MNKKSLCLAGGFFWAMAMCLLFVTQGPAFAGGRIIYIFGDFQGPEPVTS
ncbi:MAG: hypothetical protein GY850_27960, partial [bacterium]|nr:hypothetical protein [bacterium]